MAAEVEQPAPAEPLQRDPVEQVTSSPPKFRFLHESKEQIKIIYVTSKVSTRVVKVSVLRGLSLTCTARSVLGSRHLVKCENRKGGDREELWCCCLGVGYPGNSVVVSRLILVRLRGTPLAFSVIFKSVSPTGHTREDTMSLIIPPVSGGPLFVIILT